MCVIVTQIVHSIVSGGLKQSCAQAVMLYKKVCEIGPWTDHSYGPREAVKEFRKGTESSALLLSLLGEDVCSMYSA